MNQRVLKSLLGLFVVLCAVACSSGNQEQKNDNSTEGLKVLGDQKRAIRAVDRYFTEQAFNKGNISIPLTDEKDGMMWYLGPPVAYDSTTRVVGPIATVLGVTMVDAGTKKDTLLVDFKLEWDKSIQVSETVTGDFKVVAMDIRTLNKQKRYDWEKIGQFWEKVLTQKDSVQKPVM